MASGINALRSVIDRISKKAPQQDRKISVVFMNRDGTVAFPENSNKGVLLVPAEMSDIEWELENEIDVQNGKSLSS